MSDEKIINEETLLGDMVKSCVDRIKELDRPWQQLAEAEQERVIGTLTVEIKKAVKEACQIIEDNVEKVRIRAQVDSVTFKDGIKAVCKIAAHDEGRLALADAEGEYIDLVVCDIKDHLGEGGFPAADPDQNDLSLEDE